MTNLLCPEWRPRHPSTSCRKELDCHQAKNSFYVSLKCHGEDAMTNGVKNAGRDAYGWMLCAR